MMEQAVLQASLKWLKAFEASGLVPVDLDPPARELYEATKLYRESMQVPEQE